jgi:hypothetical protein
MNSALYRTYCGPKLSRRLCPSHCCCASISVAPHHNWSLGGASGDQGEATCGLGRAGAPSEDALTIAEGTPSHALLRSQPPPKTPLGEFTIPRRPRRARVRRERLVVAPEPPHRSRGRGTAAWCVVPPSSLAGAAVSHPLLDRWPRLDRRYPFALIKYEPFNQSSMTQVCYWIDKILIVRFNFYMKMYPFAI